MLTGVLANRREQEEDSRFRKNDTGIDLFRFSSPTSTQLHGKICKITEMYDCYSFYLIIFELTNLLSVSSSTASIAWNVCTDAYKTYTMLKYPAHIVAVASISIACKLQQLPQPIIPRSFFAPPALTEAVIADILDLYMHYQPHTCIGNMYTTEKLLGLCVDFQRAQKNSGRPQKPPQIDPHSSSLADEYRESNKRLQESKESCARFILDCDRKYFNTEFEKRMLEERRNKGTV